MYFCSIGAQGQSTSCCPGASGAPMECRQGTYSPSVPSASITLTPTRVMMCMLHTTYGLSVTSMPIFDIGEPSGPMENGITYIVRPAIHPWYSGSIVCLSSAGATQLLVGPASSLFGVLM